MTEMEKMKAGLEYCFTDKELIARKSLAIGRTPSLSESAMTCGLAAT